jgi:hypothetical protein
MPEYHGLPQTSTNVLEEYGELITMAACLVKPSFRSATPTQHENDAAR